jgi:hypothetical protein
MVTSNKTCLLMAARRNDSEPAAIRFLDSSSDITITTRSEMQGESEIEEPMTALDVALANGNQSAVEVFLPVILGKGN